MQSAVQNKNRHVITPEPHTPHVHKETLGRLAVTQHNESIYRGDTPNIDRLTGMPLPELSLHETLEPVRERLYEIGQATPEKLRILDRYMEDLPAPFLKRVKKEKAEDLSWADWLGGVASDEQLLNFLQWHVHSLESQQQSPAVRAEIRRQRELYQDGLARGAEQGWLHERGARRASRQIRKVATFLGDVFDTLMEGYGGYHMPDTGEIVISNFVQIDYPTFEQTQLGSIEITFTHEANHAALGSLGDTWLNEALTEHIAQVIKYGQPYELNPPARKEGEGSYAERRRLLHAFLEGPNRTPKRRLRMGNIRSIVDKKADRSARALQLAMRAYSAPPGPEKWDLNQQFINLTDEIWGIPSSSSITALAMLSSQVSMLEEKHVSNKVHRMKAQALAAKEAEQMLRSNPQAVYDLAKHERYNTVAA